MEHEQDLSPVGARRRSLEQRVAAPGPLLAWHTKLLLIVVALGIGGFLFYRHYQKEIAPWFGDLFSTGSGASSTGSSTTTDTATSATSGDVYKSNPHLLVTDDTQGAVGDQLLVGDTIVSVADVRSVSVNDKGVSLFIVSALIGNGGRKPIQSPAIQTALYDSDGRQYDPAEQEGRYAPGIAINPLLCLDRRFAFIVPDSVVFSRIEFLLPDKKTARIDLTRKKDIGDTALDGGERTRLLAAAEAFTMRMTAKQHGDSAQPEGGIKASSPQVSDLEGRIRKLQDQNLETQQTLASLADEKAAAEKDITRLQKRVKSLQKGLDDAKDEEARDEEAFKDAQSAVQSAQAALNSVQFAHDLQQARSGVSRAQQNLERQQQHLADAKTTVGEKAVTLTKAEAELTASTQSVIHANSEIDRLQKDMESVQKTIGQNQEQLDKVKGPEK